MTAKPHLRIPPGEIELHAIRASGPGGQNVNKVATAVQLRFDIHNSSVLTPAVRERLIQLAGARVSSEGVLVLTGRRFRTREANRRDVIARLEHLLARAERPPKKRIATRVPARARRARLQDKRHQAKRKSQRRRPSGDD